MPFSLNADGCDRLQLGLRGGNPGPHPRAGSAERGEPGPGRVRASWEEPRLWARGFLNNAHQCPSSRLRKLKVCTGRWTGCCAPARSPDLAFLLAVAAGFLMFLHVVTKLKGDSSPSGTDLPASSGFLLPREGSFGGGKAASSENAETGKAKG